MSVEFQGELTLTRFNVWRFHSFGVFDSISAVNIDIIKLWERYRRVYTSSHWCVNVSGGGISILFFVLSHLLPHQLCEGKSIYWKKIKFRNYCNSVRFTKVSFLQKREYNYLHLFTRTPIHTYKSKFRLPQIGSAVTLNHFCFANLSLL